MFNCLIVQVMATRIEKQREHETLFRKYVRNSWHEYYEAELEAVIKRSSKGTAEVAQITKGWNAAIKYAMQALREAKYFTPKAEEGF